MEKRICIIFVLLFVLTGCNNNLRIACSLIDDDKSINLDIKAHNDDIDSIKVRTTFVIPRTVMYDEEKLKFLNSQLNSSYHFEDNVLVNEYDIKLDGVYSYRETIKYLQAKRYYCE